MIRRMIFSLLFFYSFLLLAACRIDLAGKEEFNHAAAEKIKNENQTAKQKIRQY
ncbi:hypothetical protein [Bacillus coahuilensis]|uniref:hypothetical protein n=1 Tax=Bacillus coahuilensis TaxID=408580 RepID=UPI00187BF7C3|nr:hypothetical protein [Bacillus coahuilensis]